MGLPSTDRPRRSSSALLSIMAAVMSWSIIALVVGTEAFTSPIAGRGCFAGYNVPVAHKGAARILHSNGHGRRRPFFAVAEHPLAASPKTTSSASSTKGKDKGKKGKNKSRNYRQKKKSNLANQTSSSASLPKGKGTKGKGKNGKGVNKGKGKRRSHNNKQKQQSQKQKKKPNRANRKNNNRSPSRPYADLNTDELKQLTEYHLSQNIHPNGTISLGDMSSRQMHEFSRLISAWSKMNSNRNQEKILAAEMAEQCLRELIEEKKEGNANALKVITPDMYFGVIQSWLKVGSTNDLVHASSLLDLMERVHPKKERDENNFAKRATKCYAAVLDGWCKSKSRGSEAKAEELLKRMGGKNDNKRRNRNGSGNGSNGNVDDGRDVKHYNNVMNRIAHSQKRNGGEEAERLLQELIASYKEWEVVNATNSTTTAKNSTSSKQLAPNRKSFNTVIKAYANAGGKHAAANAERILSMMENSTSIGLPTSLPIAPDKISYTSVLLALANDESGGGGGDGSAGEKAEEMLERMWEMYRDGNMDVRPDTVAYNAVLKVWGKCGHPDAGKRSMAILDKMLELYEAGDVDVVPDDVTFNSVIHTIANSNTANSPQRAMRLLKRMEQSYDAGLIEAKPDIISYNSVLNAFAKSGGVESARRAEEMLDGLEKSYNSGAWNIRPDVYSYNIVISAWGNCGNANRAVALLDRMTARTTNEEKDADVRPDVTTYNSVLHAWSQSTDRNAPVKALGLLEIMLRLHKFGNTGANPDAHSFSTVINAFSKSSYSGKARRTRDLLRRMKRLYDNGQKNMRPNIFVYASVLNACAYTFGSAEEKEEALNIGIETYEELQQSPGIATNHVAYGSFVRVCRRLLADDGRRNHFITRAFKQCCADGQLGEYVLRQLRAVPDLYASLLQAYIRDEDGEVSIGDLPESWTCNVKDRSRKGQIRSRSRHGGR